MALAISALAVVLAFAVYFLARCARCLEAEFNYKLALQERQENECKHRRDCAAKALKQAADELSDPRFRDTDYTLGTGHGHRRAERIVNAKTWEEVEAIVFGEDLDTEKDKLQYWQTVELRERK